jgi:outer membrane protein assembly factor BamB
MRGGKPLLLALVALLAVILVPLAANPAKESEKAILSLASVPGSQDFFSADSSGFVTRHSAGGIPEAWQISNIPVRIIAVHPDGNRIAAYETDGFSVYRVSVWDWKTRTRLYAKRFRDSVTTLAWSAKGSWLIAGNTSIEGIAALDSSRGTSEKLFAEKPGIVTLALTGSSESNAITFGPSGLIRYTDTSTGKERARYQAEGDLSSPVMLSNNVIIAGYRDGVVYEIDATSGKTLSAVPAVEPVMATTVSDPHAVWIERAEEKTWTIRAGAVFSRPFSLDGDARVTAALGLSDRIVVGTDKGELYALARPTPTDSKVVSTRIERTQNRRIDDIASDGKTAYILSGGTVFTAESPDALPVPAFRDAPGTRLAAIDSQLVFWSNRASGDVSIMTADGNARRTLYKAREAVRSLSSSGTKIAFIEGSSTVVALDAALSEPAFTFAGVGLQDAIFIATDRLVISKSSTPRSPAPLISVSAATGETVQLPIKADLCYGLKIADEGKGTISGFLVKNGETSATELVIIDIDPSAIQSSSAKTALSYGDEDLAATLTVVDGKILTNLGRGAFIALNADNGKKIDYDRVSALPVRAVAVGNFIVTLCSDGTLAWYDSSGGAPVAVRSLTDR